LADAGARAAREAIVSAELNTRRARTASSKSPNWQAVAVAIAGGEDKLQWCREIGFDTGINYKKANDLTAAVKEACPKGADGFLDNTGGPYPTRS
jgi:Zn-dependent alcohol dehydrogenase